ncbi:MAG: DUF1929 domain-containing protein [Actinomycetota bacterium]|nr:DUF1929 domain-containing protein [Actinomycetota bacterium]
MTVTALALALGAAATVVAPVSAGAAVTPVATAGDPATEGSWTLPFTPAGPASRVIGVHTVLLHDGKVLTFGNLRPTVAYVYDPGTGATTETDPPADVECGGMTALEDGRVLVVGGHGKKNTGVDNITLFDPTTLTWTPQPTGLLGRYYPTTTRLPDGQVLISGGFTTTGANNTNVEVYTPPPAGSSIGTIRNVGQHLGGLYPHQWVLPNGTVFEETSRSTSILDPATWTWRSLPKPVTKHKSGEGAVLLPGPTSGSTTAALIGGGDSTAATAGVESLDADASPASWTRLPSLPQGRAHMSPVLLPDGSVLGVGGNSQGLFLQPQYSTLRYVPGSSSWTTLASQAERRGYHSSAVLLPDGRVFSAGDTGAGGGGNADEIYSPPYLFQGPRPTITAAPTQAGHGASFVIDTPDVNSRAILMEPGAATHTVDFSERHIELNVTNRSSSGITVSVPSATVALTGYYMLFLVDSTGVPSIATWIHLG